MFLNGVLVREELEPDLCTTAICSKLATRPKICKEIVDNIKWRDNYVNLKRFGLMEFFVFILVLLILFAIVYLTIRLIA